MPHEELMKRDDEVANMFKGNVFAGWLILEKVVITTIFL
jgi:hypothetical protein